jgi:hypothetical protein
MQNYAKAHSGGLIIEIDEHKWRGREERVSAAYYYAQSKYAKDATNTKTPQAVVKVIGYRHGSKAVRGTIEYIARIDAPEKGEELALWRSDGELIKGKEAIAALVKEWKVDFEKSPNSTFIKGDNAEQIKEARKPRHATHILLSADCEPSDLNYMRLEKAARDFLLREFYDKGYDYVFVVHKDTQHPHVHVIVKNRQRKLGINPRRKLKLNPNDLLHLRRQFAFELERNGIEQIATRSVDAPGRCLEALKNRIEGARKNLTWFQSKMQSPDWNKESLVDLQKYANNLQREITRIRQLTIESKLPIAQKRELAQEYKLLMNEIGAMRKDKEAELARQSVNRFVDRATNALSAIAPNAAVSKSVIKNAELSQGVDNAARNSPIGAETNADGERAERQIANAELSPDANNAPIDKTPIAPSIDGGATIAPSSQQVVPPTADWTATLTPEQLKSKNAIEERLTALQIRVGKAEALERSPRLQELGRMQRLVKRLETDIKKTPYNKELRAEQFKQLGELKRDLRKLRREPKPPQKALNEYGLDLNFDHLAAVQIGEARTAREQIKEANAGIVVIERQIKEAEQTITNIAETKLDSKERKQHIKDLETIRDRFAEGYGSHIKEARTLIEAAIKADDNLRAMPPEIKRKERELLHKTMESYNATLSNALKFASRLGALDKFSVSREIHNQQSKIERNFNVRSMGMGFGR